MDVNFLLAWHVLENRKTHVRRRGGVAKPVPDARRAPTVGEPRKAGNAKGRKPGWRNTAFVDRPGTAWKNREDEAGNLVHESRVCGIMGNVVRGLEKI